MTPSTSLSILHLLPTLVSLLLFLLSLPTASAASISNFSIPFSTWGPQPINSTRLAHVNATVYNGTLPPVNYSLPTLRLAGTLTVTGTYTTNTALMQLCYPFMIDMINARGGVLYNGSNYLLSLTYTSDDSSPNYLQLIYSQWLNDPTIAVLLTPANDDQFKQLLPLMQGTQRVWMNFIDADPANFVTHYPYVYTVINTKDSVPVAAIDTINQRAILYAQQVQAGAVTAPANSFISPYGLTSICMYTHNDTAQIELCLGIREWINSTNAARAAAGAGQADMARLVVDVFWGIAAATTDQTLYTTTFNQCPDGVDLLVVCGETNVGDFSAVAGALAATQLRPKAAYTSSTLPGFTASNSTMVGQWNGWVTHGGVPLTGSVTLPDATFSSKTAFANAWQAYYGVAPSNQQSVYPAGFEYIKGALAITASLNSTDLRQAFLQLNGTQSFASVVSFDPLTGANVDSKTVAQQVVGASGVQTFVAASGLLYPVNWPWSRIQLGDALLTSQSTTTIVIGAVMAVLGCWVGQIIVEQAVFVRRRGGWYQLWLLLVAVAVSGAGVWCAQFTMTGALTVTIPNNGQTLPISWALYVAILALLPAILICWLGLIVLMQDVENLTVQSKKTASVAQEVRQQRKEAEEEKRKRAALSSSAHLVHLKDSMTWKVGLGAALISVSIWLSRVVLLFDVSLQATWQASSVAWVISAIIALFLIWPAMLMYYHALKWRVMAVFMLAAAVLIDWQVHIALGSFIYASTVLSTPSPLYTVLISSTTISLICGIICAVTCFGFVGLQFSRMKLSRNGLAVLVASLESVINKQRAVQKALQADVAAAREQADELARIIECINILRPIPKEYAFALASQANTSTLISLFDQTQSLAAGTASSSTVSAHPRESSNFGVGPLMKPSTREKVIVEARNPRASPTPNARPSANSIVAIAAKAIALPEADDETGSRREGEEADDAVHPICAVNEPSSPSPVKRHRHSAVETEADSAREKGEEPNETTTATHRTEGQRASITTRSSSPPPAAEPPSIPTLESAYQAEPSSLSLTHVSSNTDRQDHLERCKHFEVDVMQALADHLNYHSAGGHPPSSNTSDSRSSVLRRSSITESAEFSLFVPSINGQKLAIKGSAWPVPSLSQLLQHPVCVELLKDELERLRSVENLIFYLHALRYRKLLQQPKARKAIAHFMFDTFIAEGSEQQINLSTRHRDAIQADLRQGREDGCTAALFLEAEREVCVLMETNMMKGFSGTVKHRLCVWLYHAVDMGKALGGEGRGGGGGEGGRGKSGLWEAMSKTGGRLQQVEMSRTAPLSSTGGERATLHESLHEAVRGVRPSVE